MTAHRLSILANNGDIGGGEVMLLALAEAARDAGYDVTVVAPQAPGQCADAAEERGFLVTRIPGNGRRAYMRGLRSWAKGRTELLWCNGLVPATATALLRTSHRVVHLHRIPEGLQKLLSLAARQGALTTVVPSAFMAERLGYGEVLPNWSSAPQTAAGDGAEAEAAVRVGFLGRLSPDKGVVELLDAVATLNETRPGRPVYLLLAGEPRFVTAQDRVALEIALIRGQPWLERAGWMDRDDLFSRIDLLAVPSTWEEPFGLVAIEAMAASVPLVVTDAGALPEVVGAHHPFIARRNDGDDLARVIGLMLDDADTTRAATRAAHERWDREFSPSAGAARFTALLDRVSQRLDQRRGQKERT